MVRPSIWPVGLALAITLMLQRCLKETRVYLQRPLLPRHHKLHQRCAWTRKITVLRSLVLGLLVLLGWVYLQLLVRYGTISPLATAYFTKPLGGRVADDFPPTADHNNGREWRPPFRVVVSLTTTPSRLDKVMDSVNSLVAQSLTPNQIYVNIPRGPMKRHPERSYDDIEIPAELTKLEPLVKVNRCVDDGPATKLLGALRLENDDSTLVITVDDDFVYPERLVEALAWESVAKPEESLGICGWGLMPLPHEVGVVPAYVPYFMRPKGRYVDILQACCGNAYRRGFFHDVEALADIPGVCVTVDDVWLAGYLKTVEHRGSAIISKRLDPTSPPWKALDEQLMTLSSFNHEHQIHYKCVQALELKFGQHWPRNFE